MGSVGSATSSSYASASSALGSVNTPSSAQLQAVSNLQQVSAALTQSLGALASGVGGSVDVLA